MDFTQQNTTKASNTGVEFKLRDITTGEEFESGSAVLLGPESDEFKSNTYRMDSEILTAHKDKKVNAFEVEATLELERVIACTKTLVDVEYPTGTHITTNKKQIRAFYEACPWAWRQLDAKIKSRINFLPSAEKAGKDTSSKKRG